MHDGAMDHALEAGGGLRLGRALDEQGGQLVVEILGDARPQLVEVDRAGLHHRRGIAIVQQRQEQVLQRCVLVMTLVGVFERAVQGGFEAL